MAFERSQDSYHETYTHISGFLERGVRALIYVGTYDWISNWIGNERWTLKMSWDGQDAFVSQPLREWRINGQVVGKTRSANGLTFATVDGAGHMVGLQLLVGTSCSRGVRFRMISPGRRWCSCRNGWHGRSFEAHAIAPRDIQVVTLTITRNLEPARFHRTQLDGNVHYSSDLSCYAELFFLKQQY